MNGVYWELRYPGYGICVFESRQAAREEMWNIMDEYPSAKISIRRVRMSRQQYESLQEFEGW